MGGRRNRQPATAWANPTGFGGTDMYTLAQLSQSQTTPDTMGYLQDQRTTSTSSTSSTRADVDPAAYPGRTGVNGQVVHPYGIGSNGGVEPWLVVPMGASSPSFIGFYPAMQGVQGVVNNNAYSHPTGYVPYNFQPGYMPQYAQNPREGFSPVAYPTHTSATGGTSYTAPNQADPASTTALTSPATGTAFKTAADMQGPDGCNLFVFHIPNDMTNLDLYSLFCPFGTVISARIMVDRVTGRSRGFGFVSYVNRSSADDAINCMDGCQIGHKRLKVQHKRDREEGTGSDKQPTQIPQSQQQPQQAAPRITSTNNGTSVTFHTQTKPQSASGATIPTAASENYATSTQGTAPSTGGNIIMEGGGQQVSSNNSNSNADAAVDALSTKLGHVALESRVGRELVF